MKILIQLSILLLLASSCSRKATQTTAINATETRQAGTSVSAAGATDLRRLTDLLTLTLSTTAMVTDSIHVHTIDVMTLDSAGRVLTHTRQQTTDQTRTGHRAETAAQTRETAVADSTASHATSATSASTAATLTERTREEVSVKAVPLWERILRDALGWTVAVLAVGLLILAAVVAIRRWRGRKRR